MVESPGDGSSAPRGYCPCEVSIHRHSFLVPVQSWDENSAKAEVGRLVDDYQRAKSDGRYSRFSEEETKKDFILPLFGALGWRVTSADVSAEERILRGRADYGFKVSGVTKF